MDPKVINSKREYRRKMASMPIGDKLRLLDALAERAITLRKAGAKSVRERLQASAQSTGD